jgi:NTP pyrophosphatase (non-canonical NTP hydrolase)
MIDELVDKHSEMILKLESQDFEALTERLTDIRTIRLLHAAMGLCTEAAEFLDAMKKHIFYGKPIDRANLIEELGDGDWYKGLAINALETTFEEILRVNMEKLYKRYGDKFSVEAALNRNLEAERAILETAK